MMRASSTHARSSFVWSRPVDGVHRRAKPLLRASTNPDSVSTRRASRRESQQHIDSRVGLDESGHTNDIIDAEAERPLALRDNDVHSTAGPLGGKLGVEQRLVQPDRRHEATTNGVLRSGEQARGNGVAGPIHDANILLGYRRSDRKILGRHDGLSSRRSRIEERRSLPTQVAEGEPRRRDARREGEKQQDQ